MPTPVVSVISTTNNDHGTGLTVYTSLQAWEDAAPANLVTADQIWRGEAWNDGEFTGALTIGGSTSDATRYKELVTAAGQSFADNSSKLSNALRYNQANGVGLNVTAGYTDAITITENYARVGKFQVTRNTGGGASRAIVISGSTDNLVEQCLLEATTPASVLLADTNSQISSSLFVSRSSSCPAVITVAGSGGTVVNCTLTVPSDLTPATKGVARSYASSWTVKNCGIFGVSDTGDTTGITYVNCYSDDASPPSGVTTIAYDTSTGSGFQATTDAARDFRLKNTSGLIAAGTSSGAPAVDIVGTPFGSPPSVGAWEGKLPPAANDTVTFSDSAVVSVTRIPSFRSVMELGGGPLGSGTFGAYTRSNSGGGGAVADATDTVTFSDSGVGVSTRIAAATDTLTLTDSGVGVSTRIAAATDTFSPTDSAVGVSTRAVTATDGLTLTDSGDASLAFAASASDTLAPSDSAVSTTDRVAAATDGLTLSDSAASTTDRAAVATDSLSLSDSAVGVSTRVAGATDALSLTDSSEGFVAVPAEASDSLSLTDSAVGVSSRTADAADSFTPTDSATSVTDRVTAATDTFAPADSAVSTTTRVADASDSLSLTDSAVGTAVAGAAATATDTLTLTDSAAGVTTRVATANDTLSLSDSAAADRIAVATATDGITPTDSAIGLVPRDAEGVDAITFNDTATAVVVPPTPTTGGGRAWLRAWLQQQYTKDFEEYERRRAERNRAPTAPAAPAAVAKRAEIASKSAPPRRQVEAKELAVLVHQFAAAVSAPPPLQIDLPTVPSVEDVRAVAKKPSAAASEFTAEDEELVLQIARTLNL